VTVLLCVPFFYLELTNKLIKGNYLEPLEVMLCSMNLCNHLLYWSRLQNLYILVNV